MRAFWVAPYMEDAQVVQYDAMGTQPLPPADVYIWQKFVRVNRVKERPEARHYWDVCDPVWWFSPDEAREVLPLMDGFVASNEALERDFRKWAQLPPDANMTTIPDRLELSHFDKQRLHEDVSPVRLIWYGIALNRVSLHSALTNLDRLAANGHKFELTIFDDRPDVQFAASSRFPIYHVKWEYTKEADVLASHDIALLPPYPGPWGDVKSNNKKLTAWACGLPVSTGQYYELLKGMVEWREDRVTQVQTSLQMAKHDVRNSAQEWETLLDAVHHINELQPAAVRQASD
jgi:hypothetical protein